MRNLIPTLLLLSVFPVMAADKPAPSVSTEEKLVLREAQLAVQRDQLALVDLANQILKANLTFAERQKAAEASQASLASKLNETTQKLRKASGCKDCVLNDQLEFVAPQEKK